MSGDRGEPYGRFSTHRLQYYLRRFQFQCQCRFMRSTVVPGLPAPELDYGRVVTPLTDHQQVMRVFPNCPSPPSSPTRMPKRRRTDGPNPNNDTSAESEMLVCCNNRGLSHPYIIPWLDLPDHPLLRPPSSPIKIQMSVCPADPNIKVTLDNLELWHQFFHLENEIIITDRNCVPRVFPELQLLITGLDPNMTYGLWMDMMQVGESRYEYRNNEWVRSGKAETHPAKRYGHPDSLATGAQFMSKHVKFSSLILTNTSETDTRGLTQRTFPVKSMHKYVPRVHLVPIENWSNINYYTSNVFVIHEATFIAVTQYQSEQLHRLKIKIDPLESLCLGPMRGKVVARNSDPSSLLHLCRISIRERIVDCSSVFHRRTNIQSLPLPPLLVDYLNFSF